MIFTETKIRGVLTIEPEILTDERGYFARSFCKEEFRKHGLETEIVQCNISYNKKKGTLRGMHYQAPPFEEAKIVSCTKGSIYDVVIDLRKDSRTYCQWTTADLNSENFRMIYIPKGCAHGFQTLADNSIVYYQMTEVFRPGSACGVRWNDPVFGIQWILDETIISEKDKDLSDFCP
jgi:dTDP-4-dehydrorhamnose 3,5-epimerase